jgi:hypothetical protein
MFAKLSFTINLTLVFVISFFGLNLRAQEVEKQLLQTELTGFFGKNLGFKIRVESTLKTKSNAPADAFEWSCNKKEIRIAAANSDAREHAVYHFLETVFGFNYLSADAIERPSKYPLATPDKKLTYYRQEQLNLLLEIEKKGLPKKTCYEEPAFDYREVFYGECRRGLFANFHGLTHSKDNTFENHTNWGLWVHTLHRLLPPQDWFSKHPEYFALRNGIRIIDQVCLSSKEALEIVKTNLAKEMAAKPEAMFWSVSQMDNYNYCECQNCAAIDKEEESTSGSIIRFVNEIAKAFPTKVISTLAYQYSRSAPKISKPLPNVNIMLCTIESNRAKPIAGTDFETDLANWSKLSQNILVWDYVINFSHLVGPFPNWQVLGANLSLFKKYGVKMIFEQGYNKPSGEFEPLRAYALSKLVWNPNLNTDSIYKFFIEHYYGDASEEVYALLKLQTEALNQSGMSLTLYEPPATFLNSFLSAAYLQEYTRLLDQALQKTSGEPILYQRVQMLMQSIRYATLECMKLPAAGQNWIFSSNPTAQNQFTHGLLLNGPSYSQVLDTFTHYAKLYGPSILHERYLSPQEYYARTYKDWAEATCTHKALNKAILYFQAPDKAYRDGSNINDGDSWQYQQSLNNGIRGAIEYQFNWMGWWGRDAEFIIDLGRADTIHQVSCRYLENNQAWIVGPSKLQVQAIKLNNGIYLVQQEEQVKNASVGLKLEEGKYPLSLKFSKPMYTRFLKIKIANPGKLPSWRGVNGNGWLFIDEVEVY